MAAKAHIIVLGSGSFAQSMCCILREHSVETATYVTNPAGHYAPSLSGPVYSPQQFPNPCVLFKKLRPDLVLPMSIDWVKADWRDDFLNLKIPILAPNPEGMRLEREREFARNLCKQFQVPYPISFVAQNRIEAERVLEKRPGPYVIKNPLCSPASPIHTIVCETVEETRAWLQRLDYAEGVFLQEYLGNQEAGHIAFVSNGEIYSLVTNQEYKRPFSGNMGIVAESPLGGVVEQDPEDKYGLARELLRPLLPWFREVRFHGPVQVTAIRKEGVWHTVEYNVRLGVTSGPLILRMLANPVEVLQQVSTDQSVTAKFQTQRKFGCSLHLAGYGFPYPGIQSPALPVSVQGSLSCDVWWNHVESGHDGALRISGPRIADVCAFGLTMDEAIATAHENIQKIRVAGSFYRTDIGKCLWPPGKP